MREEKKMGARDEGKRSSSHSAAEDMVFCLPVHMAPHYFPVFGDCS